MLLLIVTPSLLTGEERGTLSSKPPLFYNSQLLFYPQFRFINSRLDKMYLIQANLNPTLHLPLWRGGELTAQVIIPLYNEYAVEDSRVRPGFLTLSQRASLPASIEMLLTAGHFSMERGGVDLKLFKALNRKFGLYGQIGATFWLRPFFDRVYFNESIRVNWRIGANWLWESQNIVLNGNISQYLERDIALRGEVIRYFKNSAVGFYLQTLNYDGYSVNGGFFFAIDLPPRKRSKSNRFRVLPASDFNLEYIARPYPLRGKFYKTSPEESSSYNFFNNFLLKEEKNYYL